MANLSITQFRSMARDAQGNIIMVGECPPLSGQYLAYTTSTQSAAFHKQCRFVRLLADADVFVAFGSSPTATTSSMKLEANVAEYFGLTDKVRSGDFKLAAYDGSS